MKRMFGALTALVSACAAPGWDGHVEQFGTLREVMRDGRTEARVSLDVAARSSRTVAIGALAGLQGEIVVLDGTAWTARVENGHLLCERGWRERDSATLLARAEVRAWRAQTLDAEVPDLDEFLTRFAESSDLQRFDAWPFVIEGRFDELEAHVLNGACPWAGDVPEGAEPERSELSGVEGRLVGFFAPTEAGELVHHGQSSHVHVVLERGGLFVAHVDKVRLAPGAVLSVPESR